MLIRDLVTLNEDAEFVNDVQLGWYPKDPRSRSLAKGYIFTDKAPEGKRSSIALLEQVRDAFTYSRENRFVVIATYGHGKTHFALALANFFGMPAESEEVQRMLDNIAHGSSEAKAQGLRDFKGARAPFLVVRLRGDKPGSLPQQFLSGLETALDEHEATRGARLPLWFNEAEQFLERLTPEQCEAADAFLEPQDLDTELLLRQVRERAADRYEVCRALSRKLYGTALDFGADVSLEDAVKLVVDGYCGEGKSFAGLLVLFDEFSEFVRRYAERRGMGGASLQDLLDGVHSRQEQSALVAFSQHDPDTVAQNVFRVMADMQGQDSLSKELTRLPVPQRQTLFSSLETVLAAYLKQHEEGWDTLYDQAVAALEDATDTTMALCEARYADSMDWNVEKVSEVLTQGCFPLHPLTTALLCSVSLREVTNPRAVLGFVQEALERRQDQEVLAGRSPNWVYAVDLVDYFREMLAEKEWEQYQATVGMLGGDITAAQAQVLKAMLLVAVASLKTRTQGYAKVISVLNGMALGDCQAALRDLSENGHIHNDAANKVYSFWTAGASGNRLDKEVKKYLELALNIEVLNRDWAANGINRLAPLEVGGIGWGSPKDYEANEYLLTRATFTADRLRRMAAPFKVDAMQGMTEGVRGGLFWLVAETEADITWFQDNAKAVLDEALPGENPPPVVLALPWAARPQFVALVLRSQAFQRLPPEVRRDYGEVILRTTADRYRQALDDEMKHVKGATQFEVPAPYRVSLTQQGPARTAARALEVCYQAAYHAAPSAFFTNYSLSSQNLRKAVCRLSSYLADNRIGASEEAQAVNPVARELMTKYLRAGPPSSWGLVTVGGDLRVPGAQRTRQAWDWLDAAFKPGQPPRPVRDALVPLFNAPYGYDYHHVLLLFGAWYGFHQQYLAMQNGTRRTSLSAMLHGQDKPGDIVRALCRSDVTLSRKDKDEAEQELMELVRRMSQDTFTKSGAQDALANLAALVRDEKLAESQRASILSARERLERGLTHANEYEVAVGEVRQKIERAAAVDPLVQQYQKLSELPSLLCVRDPGADQVTALQAFARQRLLEVVEAQCVKFAKLNALEDYSMQRGILVNTIEKPVHVLGMSQLSDRVKAAIATLDARRESLKQVQDERQQDADIIAELRATQVEGSLAQLRQSLERLKEFEPRAQETAVVIQQKQEAVEQRIAETEQFVAGLPARLNKVAEGAQARKLYEEVQRRYDAYAGTPEQAEVQKGAERCEGLEKALNRVSSYRKAASTAKTPDVLADLREKAARALEQAQTLLSAGQKAQFASLDVDLSRQLTDGRRDAKGWLEECERRAVQTSAPTLAALLGDLDRPHAFLPEAEAIAVEVLRGQVQQKLDQNEVEAITLRFQRISDPQKRRACLEALQEIVRIERAA